MMSVVGRALGFMAGGGDPYFSNVVLLMHMDGANGSTTFADVKDHAITPVGNAKISTAQSKFGGASALFDGSGDGLGVADSADWDMSSTAFTIEGWLFLKGSGTGVIIERNVTPAWSLYTNGATLRVYRDGVGEIIVTGNVLSASTWHHFAIVNDGYLTVLYVDGVSKGSSAIRFGNAAGALQIGSRAGSFSWNGNMDEFRITKGVARYTGNFTPPVAAFPDY